MLGGVMKLLSTLGPFGSCVVLMVPVIACAAQKKGTLAKIEEQKKENRVPKLVPATMPIVFVVVVLTEILP